TVLLEFMTRSNPFGRPWCWSRRVRWARATHPGPTAHPSHWIRCHPAPCGDCRRRDCGVNPPARETTQLGRVRETSCACAGAVERREFAERVRGIVLVEHGLEVRLRGLQSTSARPIRCLTRSVPSIGGRLQSRPGEAHGAWATCAGPTACRSRRRNWT